MYPPSTKRGNKEGKGLYLMEIVCDILYYSMLYIYNFSLYIILLLYGYNYVCHPWAYPSNRCNLTPLFFVTFTHEGGGCPPSKVVKVVNVNEDITLFTFGKNIQWRLSPPSSCISQTFKYGITLHIGSSRETGLDSYPLSCLAAINPCLSKLPYSHILKRR